jgi:hypothetical protein
VRIFCGEVVYTDYFDLIRSIPSYNCPQRGPWIAAAMCGPEGSNRRPERS